MLRYLWSRGLRSLLTLFLVTGFAFFILRLSGDPAMMILSADAPPEAIAAFRKSWGLDAPLWQQFLGYLLNIFQGNFGLSMRNGAPAMDLVLEAIPATLAITIPAFFLKILMGVPAGVTASLYRDSWIDRLIMSLSVAGHTLPSFVFGLLLVLLFAVSLGWLPSGGFTSGWHALLPIVTLSVSGAAVLARYTRSAMLEVLGQPYIRAASAKGLTHTQVILDHALPNAAMAIVTITGLMMGSLIAGAVVVENVFSWPGVGRLMVSAVANRDLSVVQAALLLITLTMVCANLLVDAIYGFLDPRVRNQTHEGGSK
jgi:peptide/nickel transport system permease protein